MIIPRSEYVKIQALISSSRTKEELKKIAILLKALPESSEKQDLVDSFGQKWVNVN